MTWRQLARWSCFSAMIATMVFLASCGKQYPHGWVELNVAAAPVAAGWTAFKDAESGVSLAVPAGWIKWSPDDQAKIEALTDAARHVAPGTARAEMAPLPAGFNPNLFLVDTSAGSLRQVEFSYICVVHKNAGRSLSIDLAERDLKKLSDNPLERIDLPIGPGLKQTMETVGRFSNGATDKVKSVAYYMVHGSDLFVVRFTASAQQFPNLSPLIDQVMKTVRIGDPDPSAAVQPTSPSPTSPSTDGLAMPGDSGYGSAPRDNAPPEGQTNQAQGQDQTSPPDNSASSPDPGTSQDSAAPSGPPGSPSPDQDQTGGSTSAPGNAGTG